MPQTGSSQDCENGQSLLVARTSARYELRASRGCRNSREGSAIVDRWIEFENASRLPALACDPDVFKSALDGAIASALTHSTRAVAEAVDPVAVKAAIAERERDAAREAAREVTPRSLHARL